MRKIGIDLGTTNTCIYVAKFIAGDLIEDFEYYPVDIHYENHGDLTTPPELITSMPSNIYGRKSSNGDFIYYLGVVAARMAKEDRASEIINTKRLLCREDPTKIIAYGLNAQDIAQKLLEGCHYSLSKKFTQKQLNASRFCITQPAAFGLFASRSIQDAAIPAGFPNAEAQREPIAALLSFLFDQLRNPESAEAILAKQRKRNNKLLTLVVDIGGGTTDVTIQEITISGQAIADRGSDVCSGYCVKFLNQTTEDEGEPVATANQEPAFGGIDFDKAIVQNIVRQFDEQYFKSTGNHYDWDSRNGAELISGIYTQMQQYKNSLSNYTNATDTDKHDYNLTLDGHLCTVYYNSDDLYHWTESLCEAPAGSPNEKKTVYGIILDTIKRSGYRVSDIDYMYVTGGMSRYRPIRDMIERNFATLKSNGALCFSETPLADIAKGAAVSNCFFSVDMPDSTLFADLMIDDPCGEPRTLVKKSSPLPADGIIEDFMELRNPAYLYIDVLWGMNSKDCELKKIRTLRKPLPNNSITPIGTKVSVKWKIDTHQAMNIDLIVHDKHNGDYVISLLNLIKDIDLSGGKI